MQFQFESIKRKSENIFYNFCISVHYNSNLNYHFKLDQFFAKFLESYLPRVKFIKYIKKFESLLFFQFNKMDLI